MWDGQCLATAPVLIQGSKHMATNAKKINAELQAAAANEATKFRRSIIAGLRHEKKQARMQSDLSKFQKVMKQEKKAQEHLEMLRRKVTAIRKAQKAPKATKATKRTWRARFGGLKAYYNKARKTQKA
jgi:hypothetical protein